MPELSDQNLIEGLRRQDAVALQSVYSRFRGRIAALIGAWGGSEQDAQDIFQDALVAIFIRVQNDDFRLTSSFYTYLYSICQNLWLKKFRENTRHNGVSLGLEAVSMPGTDYSTDLEYAERQQFIMEKFSALGDGCRELLRLSIIEEKTPAEIMELLGFGSIEYYYKRKSNCKDKLVELSRKDARFGAI